MQKKPFITLIVAFLLIAVTLSISTTAFALTGDARPLQQSTLPQITFLGEGPQTFTVEPPLKLLVKTYQNGVFLFVEHDETSYTAKRGERVWTTNFVPAEPMRLFHEWRSYGNVPAGCVVNYVQIEDNLDDRRNTFYVNGEVIQVVEQGMVTYGSFTVPVDGEVTFYAEDSIGMVVELCPNAQTATPGDTPEVTPTATGQPTATETVEDTPTATATETGTPPATELTLTPTGSATALSTQPTPTNALTTVATASPTATVEATPTRTRQPQNPTSTATRAPSGGVVTVAPTATRAPQSAPVILVTATPISTPGAIPLTGGVPGPREIGAIIMAIAGLSGVIAAGWWFMLRTYRRGR